MSCTVRGITVWRGRPNFNEDARVQGTLDFSKKRREGCRAEGKREAWPAFGLLLRETEKGSRRGKGAKVGQERVWRGRLR